MKIRRQIEIESPASLVWNVLYTNFDRADVWMHSVQNSYALEGSEKEGRICELTDSEEGPSIIEMITGVDEKRRVFSFKAMPFNASALSPIRDSEITIGVEYLDSNTCRVIWESEPNLNLGGILISPFLRFGIEAGFCRILQDLKNFVEERLAA